MRTILVINAKGGSGKTTIATNLAGYFASQGSSVALADLDAQASSLDWLAARTDKHPPIQGIDATSGQIRVKSSTEWLIMDAPARVHGDMLAKLVRRAESLIVPVVPSAMDIRAAMRFLEEIRGLRQVVDANVKLATVGNRAREGGVVTGELEDYLEAQRLPDGRKFPFLTILRAHSNYLRAAERGLSIFEFAPFATVYDREQWAPLLRWLVSPRSVPD